MDHKDKDEKRWRRLTKITSEEYKNVWYDNSLFSDLDMAMATVFWNTRFQVWNSFSKEFFFCLVLEILSIPTQGVS